MHFAPPKTLCLFIYALTYLFSVAELDYTTLDMFIYNIMNSLQEYFMGYQIKISLFEILKIRFLELFDMF